VVPISGVEFSCAFLNHAAAPLFSDILLHTISYSPSSHGIPRIVPELGKRNQDSLSRRSVLSARSSCRSVERSGRPHTVSRAALVLADPDPHDVYGAFFCGWICPLGSIHHFFSNPKSEHKRGKQLLESNRYKRWQTTEYYILAAALIAALLGTGIVGWLDPFSFLVRSIGLSVMPVTNYGLQAALGAFEHSRFGFLQTIGGVLRFILGSVLLSFKQPYFRQGIWLGLLCFFILALNFRVTRFWCRALCPLGALLGIVSRWSVLGLVKNPKHCKDCNRCWLGCQGGDDPIGGIPWRQPECHLCLN
jgi:hypothetical protein